MAKAEKAKNDKYIDICERNGMIFFCTVGYETGGTLNRLFGMLPGGYRNYRNAVQIG